MKQPKGKKPEPARSTGAKSCMDCGKVNKDEFYTFVTGNYWRCQECDRKAQEKQA